MKTICLPLLRGEYWYGLSVLEALRFPLTEAHAYRFNIDPSPTDNQAAPLLVSTCGQYIWCRDGFEVAVTDGKMTVTSQKSELVVSDGHKTLRGAFLAAARTHFPANGSVPPLGFFKKPQYNTWIELLHDQTQEAVLCYAQSILDHGLPAGILMVDDGWSDYYGRWEFSHKKFSDPKAMLKKLHSMGFEVMLWTCPFITPDSVEFAELRERGLLVRAADGAPAIREWWNGFSAVLDLTHPEAVAWYKDQLDALMALGVDGFKFDAGDPMYYRDDDLTHAPTDANGQCGLWADFAEQFPYNELRACFGRQGKALVQRLADRYHSWDENGLASLIPNLLSQGVLGYAFTCPDMIGGGQAGSFRGKLDHLDGELFVRYAQCSALMPMMQFSAAPWRVLSPEYARLCIEAAKLHERFADRIAALAQTAADTGEPIARYLEYVFPGEGLSDVTDQFMLGDDILVAPVLEKGAVSRRVRLPGGSWRGQDGIAYTGGETVTVSAPLNTLPYFVRCT